MAEETKKIVKKTVTRSASSGQAKVAKPAVKVAKPKVDEVHAEVAVPAKTTEKKAAAVSIDVIGIDGKVTGKISLPGEMFGEKVNKALLAQAVRVYLANQRQGTVSTKTRGEVDGSTAKIYRQKGTGRARHGSKRAPIFVKGGIVFGPKPRDFRLSLPQKMKRQALFSALSAKIADHEIVVIDGLSSIEPKTKKFVEVLKNVGIAEKKRNVLVITTSEKNDSVLRAGRNVQGISFLQSKLLNTYEVLSAGKLLLMKDAVEEMKAHFLKK